MSWTAGTVTVTAAGTAVQFSSTDTRKWRRITLSARPTNGSAVYAGTSTVSSSAGLTLMPGGSIPLSVTDDAPADAGIALSDLYADASANNDQIDFFAYAP